MGTSPAVSPTVDTPVPVKNEQSRKREQMDVASGATENTDARERLVRHAIPVRVLHNDDVAFASASARNCLHDALEVFLGIAEQTARRMVEWLERICRIGDPAHCDARACRGAHAGDDEIVEPPRLDGNLLQIVAKHH